MPYWSIYCFYCQGYIVDALLECIPEDRRSNPAYRLLFYAKPGAVLACPYCGGLIGFDDNGQPRTPESGWKIFRYGRAELESKKDADGEPATTSLTDWAIRHRFTSPGSHEPFTVYTYAEQTSADESVP